MARGAKSDPRDDGLTTKNWTSHAVTERVQLANMYSVRCGDVLTLCGLALRSTRMTRPRVQRTSP